MRRERETEETLSYTFHGDQDPLPRRVLRKPKSSEFEITDVKKSKRRKVRLSTQLAIHLPSERENPVETPYLDLLNKDTNSKYGSILQFFITTRGPQSIVRRVVRTLGYNKLATANFENDSIDSEAMNVGAGIAFERLAHLWLDNQTREKDKNNKVVDPGSASRVFESLRHFNGHIDFTPDGLLFSNFNPSPILSGLLEYKMSPLLYIDDLKSQLKRMQSFINTFAGGNLRLDTKLDLYSSKKIKTIKIARKPNIILVIPSNRIGDVENIPQDIPVIVLTTPFPSDFVRQVTTASLRDFGKTIIGVTQKITV